jgi:predicted nucleic acid-binding protein
MTLGRGHYGPVMVDTSALYALLDPSDGNHILAIATLRRIAATHRLLTTNFLLAETHALILSRRGRSAGQSFLTQLQGNQTGVIRVLEQDEARAIEIIFEYHDKDFSYADATTFAVMERLGIEAGFSFDRHFRQYGWHVLPERLT